MQRRHSTYKWLLAACLLWGWITSSTWASSQAMQPAAWTTTPMMSEDVRPVYDFRSTSTVNPIVGTTSYTATPDFYPGGTKGNRMRKSDPWGPPEDDPIGVLPDPAPIGEPLILLAMALLYFVWRRRKVRE